MRLFARMFVYEKQCCSSFWAPYVIPLYNAQAWRLGKKIQQKISLLSLVHSKQRSQIKARLLYHAQSADFLMTSVSSALRVTTFDLCTGLRDQVSSDGEMTAPTLLSTRLLCLWVFSGPACTKRLYPPVWKTTQCTHSFSSLGMVITQPSEREAIPFKAICELTTPFSNEKNE